MPAFQTLALPAERTVVAPDGSDVRVLLGLAGGGMAHFSLPAPAGTRWLPWLALAAVAAVAGAWWWPG